MHIRALRGLASSGLIWSLTNCAPEVVSSYQMQNVTANRTPTTSYIIETLLRFLREPIHRGHRDVEGGE